MLKSGRHDEYQRRRNVVCSILCTPTLALIMPFSALHCCTAALAAQPQRWGSAPGIVLLQSGNVRARSEVRYRVVRPSRQPGANEQQAQPACNKHGAARHQARPRDHHRSVLVQGQGESGKNERKISCGGGGGGAQKRPHSPQGCIGGGSGGIKPPPPAKCSSRGRAAAASQRFGSSCQQPLGGRRRRVAGRQPRQAAGRFTPPCAPPPRGG
jgi:hypothetical protein